MELEKAFDKDALVAALKAEGLPEVEDLAEKCYRAMSKWLKASADLHENAFVRSGLHGLVGALDPIMLEKIDKIDGIDGNLKGPVDQAGN